MPTIDCEDAERRLHGYLDREISDGQAREVRQHLEACENCRSRFRFEVGLRRLVKRVAERGSAPAGLGQRIRGLLRGG